MSNTGFCKTSYRIKAQKDSSMKAETIDVVSTLEEAEQVKDSTSENYGRGWQVWIEEEH